MFNVVQQTTLHIIYYIYIYILMVEELTYQTKLFDLENCSCIDIMDRYKVSLVLTLTRLERQVGIW